MIEQRKINGIIALKSYKPANEVMSIGDGLSHLGDRKNDGTTVCLGIVAENVASGQYFYYYPLGTDGVQVAAGEELDLSLNSALKYVSGSGWLNAESADPVSAIVSEPVGKNDPINEVAAGEYVYVSLDAYYNGGSGGGGEANTASNVGTAGVGLFKQKSSSTLQFKNINAGSSKITVTDDTDEDEVDIDVDESELTHANIGGLTADDHTQYALLLGRSGGQSLIGGTAASNNLTLSSTSNATKGSIIASSNINIATGYSLLFNGADINTGGTLDNIAYLDTANTFTATNVFNMVDNTENAFHVKQGTNDYLFIDTLNGSETLNLTVGGSTPAIIVESDAVTINEDMTLSSVNQVLSSTTNADQNGILYKDSDAFLHDFNYGDNGTVTTEGNNIFLGAGAGNLTMGSTATATTESSYNIGIGSAALFDNTTGSYNIGVGYNVLTNNTTGKQNVSIGESSMTTATDSDANVGIGYQAFYALSTGCDNNIAIGSLAGRYITGGSTPLTVSTSSIFIGTNTKAAADSEENQIVIGYGATGLGSNTIVLGNSSNTKTALTGNIGIGTTTPSEKLHIYESTAADLDLLTARSNNANVVSHTFLGADTVSPTKPYYSIGIHGSEDILTIWLNDGSSDIDALSVGLDGTVEVDNSIMFTEVTSAPDDPTDGAEARIYVKDDKLVIQYNDSATVRYKYLDLTGTGATWTHTTTPV